jgi:alpha-tubulin suppressor-like RCC1 family protein
MLALTNKGQVLSWVRDRVWHQGPRSKMEPVENTERSLVTPSTVPARVCLQGKGEFGRLGHGTTSSVPSPKAVDLLEGVMCVQVAAGSHHALALTADGRIFAWGKNECGQLGQGSALVRFSRP